MFSAVLTYDVQSAQSVTYWLSYPWLEASSVGFCVQILDPASADAGKSLMTQLQLFVAPSLFEAPEGDMLHGKTRVRLVDDVKHAGFFISMTLRFVLIDADCPLFLCFECFMCAPKIACLDGSSLTGCLSRAKAHGQSLFRSASCCYHSGPLLHTAAISSAQYSGLKERDWQGARLQEALVRCDRGTRGPRVMLASCCLSGSFWCFSGSAVGRTRLRSQLYDSE